MGVGFSAWRKLRALKAEGAGGGGGGYGRGSGEHTEKHCKELFEIYDRDKDGVLDARKVRPRTTQRDNRRTLVVL